MTRRLAPLLLLIVGFAALPGCDVIGYTTYVAFPDKAEPLYKLQLVPTLVFVEDRRGVLPHPNLLGRIAGATQRHLAFEYPTVEDLKEDELPSEENPILTFIDGRKVNDLAASEPDFPKWSIGRIGRAVGARQVIYVAVESWSVKDETGFYDPESLVLLKVIDPASGKRVFPTDAKSREGLPIVTTKDYRHEQRWDDLRASYDLAEKTGRFVARTFYEYVIDESNQEMTHK